MWTLQEPQRCVRRKGCIRTCCVKTPLTRSVEACLFAECLSLSLSPFLPNLLFFPFFLFPLSHLFLIPFFFFFLFIFLFPSPILFSSYLRYQDHRCPRQQTHRYRRVRKRYKKECVDDTEECMKEDTKEWAKENTEECVKESTKECVKEDTEERVKEDTEECVEVTTEYLANE